MSNLITQNYYTTQTVTEVQASATGEISIQLLSAPIWEFWILLFGEDSNMEEIFFHRRSWNTIYTYEINRSNPKTHPVWTNVVMNDSAWIFNYLSKNVYNHFYCYKESDTSVFVFGWLIFKEWIIEIPNKSLTISEWMNYIYLDDNFEIQVSSSSTNKYTVWLVTKSWSLINITKYNVLSFGKDWKDGIDWTNGTDGKDWKDGQDWTNGTDWIDGKTITSASFNWDDIDFTMNDSSVVKLLNAKIDLKWPQWDIWNPWETQEINDVIQATTGSITTYNNTQKWIRTTYTDWTYVLYVATWNTIWWTWIPAWIYNRDSDHSEISTQLIEWVYSDIIPTITFSDWKIVNWIDWSITISNWNIAYTNNNNTFKKWKTNIFEWDVIFKWGISHPFHTINLWSSSTINFDGSLGENQKIVNMTTPWAKTLNISNVYPWRTYWLAINNQTWWNVTIVAGTVNSNGITWIHSLWWQVSTQTMATGSAHMLFMYTSENGIHISYLKSWVF